MVLHKLDDCNIGFRCLIYNSVRVARRGRLEALQDAVGRFSPRPPRASASGALGADRHGARRGSRGGGELQRGGGGSDLRGARRVGPSRRGVRPCSAVACARAINQTSLRPKACATWQPARPRPAPRKGMWAKDVTWQVLDNASLLACHDPPLRSQPSCHKCGSQRCASVRTFRTSARAPPRYLARLSDFARRGVKP